MNDAPTRVNRALTPHESALLRRLALEIAANGIGCDIETTAAAIAKLTDAGRVSLHADPLTARITVGGRTLVEARRDWLQFRAALEDWGSGAVL
ncbi:hypothetical protein A5649_09785 [Mycolicibacter heraklionensis]|uniref:Uncharacterized protein n=1 Tax=Mycolicibacter heraklionensis TaxID=512402 RepID=A0AA91EV66_9MYCO|nr:hypothetical protein [Mycolicibacter heraklionensis]OBK82136.1 hypothetical protein A5649_09785 [Mycolicibacter heraklionensis]